MFTLELPIIRITAFRDTWPRLGEWYGEKQNILVTIEANVDEDELYDRLAGVLQPVLTHKPDGSWFLFTTLSVVVFLQHVRQTCDYFYLKCILIKSYFLLISHSVCRGSFMCHRICSTR